MELQVKVGVSVRHIHLKKETYKKLFGDIDIAVKNYLSYPGEFASQSTLTIKNGDKVINDVRVLGPFRDYNQVEISQTDAYYLKVNPKVRKSGDLNNSETIKLVGPAGVVDLKEGLIIAKRHLHIDSKLAKKLNIMDDEKLIMHINTSRGGTMYLFAKVNDDAPLEIHLDTDEANAFSLNNGDEVKVTYEF